MPSPARPARSSTALTAEIAAKAVGCKRNEIFLASTGVIGEPLDATKFDGVLDDAGARRRARRLDERRAAIMTTDTFPKVATATREARQGQGHHQRHGQGRRHDRARHGDDAVVRVHRRADRGAGACRRCCKSGVEDTFNAVTIDGDTSTSDTLLAFATGAAARTARRRSAAPAIRA